MSLRAINFQPNQIEQAMTAIVLKGGDIVDTLDWLCLNLPDGNFWKLLLYSFVVFREYL